MTDSPRFELTMPEEFARIGYSGLFWLAVGVSVHDLALWRVKVPCLIRPDGWLALAVMEPPSVVVVRRDSAAIMDLVTNPTGAAAPPNLSRQLP